MTGPRPALGVVQAGAGFSLSGSIMAYEPEALIKELLAGDGGPHPTRATRGHETDAKLRKHGFRIHARPARGVPVWEKGGILFAEDDAVLEIMAPGVT